MTEISATVVTLNEEENIRDCLETLTWCDEIVIVDSYSDDDTVEIAREYTDKIYTFERTGYSEPARKKALEEASGEWICMIDADEMVPTSLATQLQNTASTDDYDVIYAPRKNYILGKWIRGAGWWPDYRPVLYKNEEAILSGEIHDFLSFPDEVAELRLEPVSENAVVHFNYTDVYDFISRMNRYTEIEASQTDVRRTDFLIKPLKEFGVRFLWNSGYKLGFRGIFLSIFMSWYKFLVVAKAWEQENWGGENVYLERYEDISNDILSKHDE